MTNFAADLAGTISNIADWADSDDFAALLTGMTIKLRDVLQTTSEPALYLNASVLAAEAVRLACVRDGIAAQAGTALS